MSLNIYVDNVKDAIPVAHNVEEIFDTLDITDTIETRQLIEFIEQGEYISPYRFRSRFGEALNYDDMSTGCKAALCVLYRPDLVIDTLECGHNAKEAIIKYLKSGAILVRFPCLLELVDEEIDVHCNDYHITDGGKLGNYLLKEYPNNLGSLWE